MTARTTNLIELEDDLLLDEELEEGETIYYYYDIEENYRKLREERGDMPTADHNELVDYIIQILRWQYADTNFTIHREINFYSTDEQKEKPLYPDTFIIKGKQKLRPRSIRLYKDIPAPSVIIEVLSDNTVPNDLVEKPESYAKWGVKEYFVYDPRERKRRLKKPKPRLYGWQIRDGKAFSITPGKDGGMWSHELESRLVPAEKELHFYDKDDNLRLTELEFRTREVEAQKQARLEAERRELAALAQAEQERAAKEAERAAKEAERAAKETAYQRLRELGIDPDKL
jgi:Uma2 family endonuclease